MKKLKTKQDLFQAAVTHIVTQGYRSTSDDSANSVCMYRDYKGGGCAYGGIFPEYVRKEVGNIKASITMLIGSTISGRLPNLAKYLKSNPVYNGATNGIVPEETSQFLSLVQDLHDRHLNWLYKKSMVREVTQLAIRYGLSVEFLKALDWTAFNKNARNLRRRINRA